MTQVDAIYQNGVFKPLQDIELPENHRVRLSVQPVEVADVQAWLAEVQERRQRTSLNGATFPTAPWTSLRTGADERYGRG